MVSATEAGSRASAPDEARTHRIRQRLELVATVLLAVATIATAWSAFESTKWSGVQANSYSNAATARTESNSASTRAGQQAIVDINLFTQWLQALNDEHLAAGDRLPHPYTPDPTTLSGFLFQRFRAEFQPAVHAWLRTHPGTDTAAPASPFVMIEYRLADAQRAETLSARADRQAALARAANQRADNYVLTTVLFASVLFFAGISTKLEALWGQYLMLGLGVLVMLAGVVTVLTLPVQV